MGEKPRAGLEKPRGVFQKPRGFFNFDHFFHHDGIYFFSHNYICFAPLCLYLCNLVVLSLLHHKKDDVILPNSGVAKKNWWLFVVKVQEMFSLHGGLLTNAMYHHGETL